MADGQAAPAPAPQPASDPVARIQAIINAEPGNSPSKRASPQQSAQAETPAPAEQPAAEPEATPEAEAPAKPNTQVEGEDAPSEDAQAKAEIPLDQLETIAIPVTYKGEDGKDITENRTIKELREGSMRQADYSRKTAELARQREQIREETRKVAEAERVKYATELQTMHDLVMATAEAELSNVNWKDLAQNNAFEYVRLDNRRKEINSTLQSIKEKQADTLTKHRTEQETVRREQASKAIATLEADIPGWNDAHYQTLMKAAIEKHGYKQDEVAAWIDPRAFKLLHKAHLYDQMQSEKTAPAPDKKVAVPPKALKPGTVQNVNQVAQRDAAAMKQLRTSHSIQDAAAVIRSRLG